MNQLNTENISPDIISMVIAGLPEVGSIYLFGSFVTGEMTSDSDIDIALLTKSVLSPELLLALSASLSRNFNRDVDIVDMHRASTVFRMQIISKGRRLFCRNHVACEAFEDFVFSDYARLNEERAGILHDIHLRGSVYG